MKIGYLKGRDGECVEFDSRHGQDGLNACLLHWVTPCFFVFNVYGSENCLFCLVLLKFAWIKSIKIMPTFLASQARRTWIIIKLCGDSNLYLLSSGAKVCRLLAIYFNFPKSNCTSDKFSRKPPLFWFWTSEPQWSCGIRGLELYI